MATQHAGDLKDPIPQKFIYKNQAGKFFVVGGTGGTGGTIDPRVGNLNDLTTTEKGTVVAALNEVAGRQGAGDATEAVKGIAKLSDAVDSTLDAHNGATAATPLAVKTVDSKIGNLTDLETQAKTNVVEAINELKQTGGTGGGGGNANYVLTPEITSPVTGAVGQNVKPVISGSPFISVVPGDSRKHRVFEISKDADFSTKAVEKNINADSWTVETALDASTKFYVRIKDIGIKGGASGYSVAVNFTTGTAQGPLTPTLTLKGFNDSPTDIGSGLKITASPYTTADGSSDIHKATSWSIKKTGAVDNVWEELNSVDYKTEVIVPDGTLEPGTAYTVTCIYHSTSFTDAAPAQVNFTTSTDFGRIVPPVVSISGFPTSVSTLPTIRGGVFTVTRVTDRHVDTEIKVIRINDSHEVFTKTFGSAATSVTLETPLSKRTQYTAKVRYKGEKLGWSDWGVQTFTTDNDDVKYNYIGVPGSIGFGVGLARPEAYQSIVAGAGTPEEKRGHELPGTRDPRNFQYGLYQWGNPDAVLDHGKEWAFKENHVAICMNWIPKYYIASLWNEDDKRPFTDEELTEKILPYVEVTFEQLKEAIRRSPENGVVIAPGHAFANRAEANKKGFYLPRAFINAGKEVDGFFFANTETVTSHVLNFTDKKFKIFAGYHEKDNYFGQSTSNSTTLVMTKESLHGPLGAGSYPTLDPKNVDDWFWGGREGYSMGAEELLYPLGSLSRIRAPSVFMIQAVRFISYCHGLFASSTEECAWLDVSMVYNGVRGVNNSKDHKSDSNDATVFITNRYDTKVSTTVGANNCVFANNYEKTTMTGQPFGPTHLNGWLPVVPFGINICHQSGSGGYGNNHFMQYLKESVDYSTVTDQSVYYGYTNDRPHDTLTGALWEKYSGATIETLIGTGHQDSMGRQTSVAPGDSRYQVNAFFMDKSSDITEDDRTLFMLGGLFARLNAAGATAEFNRDLMWKDINCNHFKTGYEFWDASSGLFTTYSVGPANDDYSKYPSKWNLGLRYTAYPIV